MSRRSPGAGLRSSGFNALEREVTACELCPRLREHCRDVAATKRRAYRDQTYWGRPVSGFGDSEARLLLVGLAPGAHGSNRTGRMFTGDSSGDFLYSALHRAGLANRSVSVARGDGLALRGVYITAVARCAPPGNRPARDEIANCRPFLLREFEMLDHLRAILALGAIAWMGIAAALAERGTIERKQPAFGHGVFWNPGPGGPAVFAAYHPSRQNTQTGRLNAGMFDRVLRAAAGAAGVLDSPSGDQSTRSQRA